MHRGSDLEVLAEDRRGGGDPALCILLGEQGCEALEELEGSWLLSSAILPLEACRNLVRLALDLCRNDVMPVVTTPRSFDLAHLRTAAWYHQVEPLTRFVSLDQVQLRGAAELGLPVAPG